MRYQKIVDLWKLTEAETRKLQPGQWVFAGENIPFARGKFWGVKPSGTVVVAWQGNARTTSIGWTAYQRNLRNYALG